MVPYKELRSEVLSSSMTGIAALLLLLLKIGTICLHDEPCAAIFYLACLLAPDTFEVELVDIFHISSVSASPLSFFFILIPAPDC